MAKLTRFSLLSPKGLLLLLAYLCLTPIITYFLSNLVWEREFSNLQVENKNTSVLFTSNLESSLQQNAISSKLIAQSQAIIQFLTQSGDIQARQVNKFLSDTNASIKAGVIYIMSLDGTTLASSNWYKANSFVGKNYAFRPYFQHALKGESYAYTALGVTSGKLGYYYATPVQQNQQILGVVVVKTNLTEPQEFLARNESKLLVADPNGVIILTTEPAWKLHTLRPIEDATRRDIIKSRQYEGASLLPIKMTKVAKNEHGNLVSLSSTDSKSSLENEFQDQSFIKLTTRLGEQGWQLISLMNTNAAYRMAFLAALVTGLTGTVIYLLFLYYIGHRNHLSQLHELSIRDSLTGLYNRRHMIDIGAAAISKKEDKLSTNFVTVMIDIDHFKKVNDSYGHAAGDLVLQKISKVIRNNMRSEDLAVRYGGEEFVLLFSSLSPENDKILVERIRDHIKALRFTGPLKDLRLSITTGIAYHLQGESFDETVARADALMYQAKKKGRDRIFTDQDQGQNL